MSALALCLALPAHASSEVSRIDQATQQTHQSLPDEVVGVQSHRSPAGAIIGDAIGGAVIGGLVGGGVAFYNRYGTSNGDWGNWQRDVLVGAGIGLGVGLIVGGIDAASNMDRTYQSFSDQRSVGFQAPLASHALRF
ncbi:MAG: hypothetical protein ACXWLM_11685 [Myxococcales bacterium]